MATLSRSMQTLLDKFDHPKMVLEGDRLFGTSTSLWYLCVPGRKREHLSLRGTTRTVASLEARGLLIRLPNVLRRGILYLRYQKAPAAKQ